MAHVDLIAVSKSFGDIEVIPPLDLAMEKGEFIVLVGPSGCGKTTTLRIISGLAGASGGKIRIAGRDVTNVRPGERDCAMVFQNYALYPHMTVRDNIGYAMKVHKTPKGEIEEQVSKAATLLGLTEYLDHKPSKLSGGQRQRVAIGRTLVRQPEVILFDEPLSNLDAKLRVEMRAEIRMLRHRLGTTTVYVTHAQFEAMTMAARVVVMHDGRIEQVAAPITLYEEPANRFVANFIGSPAMSFFDVAVDDGNVFLDGQRLVLPRQTAKRLGQRKKVIFGIRPEHMRDGAHASDLTLTVKSLEPLGAHTLILGMAGRDKIVAQVDPRFPAEEGKPCTVKLDMKQAHFFDPETEERL